MIVKEKDLPTIDKQFTATISWMGIDQLCQGQKYLVQHGVNKVLAKVDEIHHKINPDYSGLVKGIDSLDMNDIATVTFKLNKPIFYDSFKAHRTNGSFIIIDQKSNGTVGAGFIN